MVVLDSDHMSLLDRGGAEGVRIRNRLRLLPLDDIATSIVTYEEQTRGWMARVARANSREKQVEGYSELKRQLRNYCDIAVIDYDDRAAAIYERLRKARPRGGTMDLKIAAIALAHDAVLLTRNRADFETIPDLRFEDWSV